MIAWISGKLTGAWMAIAGVAVALVAAAAIVARLLAAGRDGERAAAARRALNNVEKRNEVDRNVAREPDPAGRLRDKWSRD